MQYNIVSYGAVADGTTLNTRSIQSAIDDCAAHGGGRVTVPAGVFKTGTIMLKDNIELHLMAGAVLLGSERMEDYNSEDAYPQCWGSVSEEWKGAHILLACECSHIAITGFGVIDGNAECFYAEAEPNTWASYVWPNGLRRSADKEKLRPGQTVALIECRHVTVENITIRNSTCWSCYVHGCEFVSIRGIRVFNADNYVNTDGVDIDSSRYVTVSDCVLLTGDDAIAIRCDEKKLKNKDVHCEYVTVTNCVLSSSSSVIRIGVGTGTIKHVRISNIVVKYGGAVLHCMTQYSGRGDAKIEDVNFSQISVDFAGYLLKIFAPDAGFVRDISIDGVRGSFAYQSFITGSGNVSNVDIRNVQMHMLASDLGRDLDSQYRGSHVFQCQGANDITLENMKLTGQLDAWEGMLLFENCQGIQTRNCTQ